MLPPQDLDLDPADWTRVRAALEAALECEPEARKRVLRDRLADVPRLADIALGMLALDEGEARDTALPAGTTPGSGRRIGPYVTRRVMGAGGMGTVYLAVRADGAFKRQVALKLIRPHLDTREVLARFQRERQVQANLEHPGIVRLLDGGETEEGLPYLVMEYVDGLRIDEYCDQYRLTNAERLRLFRKVAEAVQHAHDQLVVHRDLKPSNILVTADGEPKLLDFGIAKVLDPEKLSGDLEVTRGMMRFVTPAYASPEQLRGLPVTAAADIYSLGVLLYRLLTGHPPHRLDGLSPAEVERRVCEVDPARPSEAVMMTRELPAADRRGATTRITPQLVAERRRANPRALRKALAGDLDRLVGMCLRREPQRRYASAAALGEDIDRFLAGRPIFARPDTWLYRTRKFVARNRVQVAMIAALAGSLTYSLVQNRRVVRAHANVLAQKTVADERLERLRSLGLEVLRDTTELYIRVPQALAQSERLMQTLRRHIDEEASLAADDPRWLVEVGDLFAMLGKTLYSSRSSSLGRAAEALASYESALEVLERARELRPESSGVIYRLGNVLEAMGAWHFAKGDDDAAAACHQRVLELVAPFSPETESKNSGLVMHWCLANDSLGRIRSVQGRTGLAREHAETTVRTWRALLERKPEEEPILAGSMAMAQVRLADVMIEQGLYAEALDVIGECEEPLRRVQRAHGSLDDPSRTWATLLRKKSRALQALGLPGALAPLHEAVSLARERAARAPDDVRSSYDLGICLAQLTRYFLDTGDHVAAEAHARESVRHGEQFLERWPDLSRSGWRIAHPQILLAEARLENGGIVEASELLGAGMSRLAETIRRSPRNWDYRRRRAEAWILRGRIHVAEAERALDPADRRAALELARTHVSRALEAVTRDTSAGLGEFSGRRLADEAREWEAKIRARLEALD